jgi:transaldolase
MTSKLAQLAAMTTIVADTGDIEAVRRLKPVDCTTNPTLILKAAGMEAYAPLVEEAVNWGLSQAGSREARIEAVCDRLAVTFGAELSRLVPGRVSTEVDADLSFDVEGSIAKGRALIADYAARGVDRSRVLIKLAATWEGIQAARVLQQERIDCNLTLLFSMVQAKACADAKVYLISPFVGRILDWHVKAGGGPYTAETDPGVVSVKAIYDYYKDHGVDTVVMGASFRNMGEIEALAGCDRLTISPALLDELAKSEGDLPRALKPPALPVVKPREALSEKDFRHELNEDAMAVEKLSEGIRGFVKDMRELRRLVAARLVG